MFKGDTFIIRELLNRIEESINLITMKTDSINSADDFLSSPDGMFLLSGVSMQLIFIGENVKTLDKKTDKKYLLLYPQVPWKLIMGLRDMIVHEYHKIDADEIYNTVKSDLPLLLSIIKMMQEDL